MAYKYNVKVSTLPSRPRSRRMRETGIFDSTPSTSLIGGNNEGSVVDPNSHKHGNLYVLESLSYTENNYLYITQKKEDDEEAVSQKVKSGFADEFPDVVKTHKTLKEGLSVEEGLDVKGDLNVEGGLNVKGGLSVKGPANMENTEISDLKVNQGIDIGEFVPGFTGMGIRIKNGKIEADSMELRKSLTVPELIYNRVQIIGGEMWVTEGGVIESLEPDGGPQDNLYRCKLKDIKENDVNPFQTHDILKGVCNTKDASGSFTGFYTIELRVEDILPDQTMRVVPRFSDFPPVDGLTIARIGNFTNPERQRSIYLSSKDGYIRFLDGVDGWDIEKRMIVSWWGQSGGFEIPGLEGITGYNAYMKNVIVQNLITVSQDETTTRPLPCFKGAWIPGTFYYYDEVTHNGCKYLCIVKPFTTAEPQYDSADWLCTEGNKNIALKIISSAGDLFIGLKDVDTHLIATVRAGYTNITEKLNNSQFIWTRNSGNHDSDTAWNRLHAGAGPAIQVRYPEDIPGYDPVTFTCIATLTLANEDFSFKDEITI